MSSSTARAHVNACEHTETRYFGRNHGWEPLHSPQTPYVQRVCARHVCNGIRLVEQFTLGRANPCKHAGTGQSGVSRIMASPLLSHRAFSGFPLSLLCQRLLNNPALRSLLDLPQRERFPAGTSSWTSALASAQYQDI